VKPAPGAAVPELDGVRRATEHCRHVAVAEIVPQNQAQNLSFGGSKYLHGGVHPCLKEAEAWGRAIWISRFPDKAICQSEPPHGRTAVIGDHATCDPEEPQAILRCQRDHLEATPRYEKYLRNDILGVMRHHASLHIVSDRLTMAPVERVEARRAVVCSVDCDHSACVRPLSVTQRTWPGPAKIRQHHQQESSVGTSIV
jgi:hypothetical protein